MKLRRRITVAGSSNMEFLQNYFTFRVSFTVAAMKRYPGTTFAMAWIFVATECLVASELSYLFRTYSIANEKQSQVFFIKPLLLLL